MGPNAAAKQYISKDLLDTPWPAVDEAAASAAHLSPARRELGASSTTIDFGSRTSASVCITNAADIGNWDS